MIRLAIAVAVVLTFYGIPGLKLAGLAPVVARALRLDHRAPVEHSLLASRLIVATLVQALFCALLIIVSRPSTDQLVSGGLRPVLLVYGVFLGVGEMAAATLLCHWCMSLATVTVPTAAPAQLKDWLAIGRAGWMQQYLRTVEVLPGPAAGATILLYVAGEELVFRGLLITCLRPLGAPVAVTGAAVLFAAVQAFGMPSWRSAMFPVVGAVVVGIVHGLLFVSVPNVLPLVVAHAVFFVAATA